MDALIEYLKLLQIPYTLFNVNKTPNLFLPINEKLQLGNENNYLIFYRRIIFYGYLPVNKEKILLIGPLTAHRVYGMETFEIFFCYNSSERYNQLKNLLYREPLTDCNTFYKLLKNVIKDYHFPHQNLLTKEFKKNPTQNYNFTQLPNTEIQKEVIAAIRFGNLDRLYSIVNNPAIYSDSVINTKNPPKSHLQYFYFSTISRINDIAAEAGVAKNIRDNFTSRYTSLWNNPTIDAKEIGHLLVQAMIETAQECRRTIYFNDKDPILHQVLQYVSNHANQKITRAKMASDLNLSPSYLSHYFKNKTKMTLTYFVNLFKINRAKYLLATTNASVLEISESLAFSNVTYFNRLFNKIAKETPSTFRKEIEEKARFAPNDESY